MVGLPAPYITALLVEPFFIRNSLVFPPVLNINFSGTGYLAMQPEEAQSQREGLLLDPFMANLQLFAREWITIDHVQPVRSRFAKVLNGTWLLETYDVSING